MTTDKKKFTLGPWIGKYVPGAGCQVWANIPGAEQIQPIYQVAITP